MIDTHCHLDSPRFASDRDEVLQRARDAGLTDLVVPAVGPATWEPLLEWAASRPTGALPRVHVGLGIHPQLLPDLPAAADERHLARLEELLSHEQVVCLGECGLDGPVALVVPMERQLDVLRAHVLLGRRFRLPLALHCLRAHEALLGLLAEEPLGAGGVMHSYSGSAEQLRDYLPHGLHFAVAGPVTWERARKPVNAARAIPADRLVLETDAPDQTPRPHSGRCEPAFLQDIARAVAEVRGLSLEGIDTLTSSNARGLFRLGA